MKVECWCDSPRDLTKQKRVFLAAADGSYREMRVRGATASDRFVLLSLEGVDDRETAAAYKERILYLSRDDISLPKDRVLIADLIGTPVTDADSGRCYGTVRAITDGVRYALISVDTGKGEVLLPDIPQFIVRKDAEGGIFVRPIPGFFEE